MNKHHGEWHCSADSEISKNENSINPYNRESCNRIGSFKSGRQDYHYGLVNSAAAYSVKSSYFDFAADNFNSRDSSLGEWMKHETFKRIKSKVEEAVKV